MDSRLVQELIMAIRKQHERREQESWRSARNDPKLVKARNVRARQKATWNAEQRRGTKRIGESIFKEIGL